MKIKYLGTAAAEGVPALFCQCDNCKYAWTFKGRNIRSRAQALINDDLLIDFGPDTYKHVLDYNVPLDMIHHILITHKHSDHFYRHDLLFRRPGYASKIDEGPVFVYGTQVIYDRIDKMVNDENMQEQLQAKMVVPYESYNFLSYTVTPLIAQHDQDAGSVIYLIKQDNKSILYAHDTGYFVDETWDYLSKLEKPLDLISLDCTIGLLKNWNYGHLSFDCFLQVIDRLKTIKAIDNNTIVIANHFSHNGKASYDEMVKEAQKYNVIIAFDGMEIDI